MLIKAPRGMTVEQLLKLLKYDDIDIILDRRHGNIYLDSSTSYGNEKLASLGRVRDIAEDRYNNGG